MRISRPIALAALAAALLSGCSSNSEEPHTTVVTVTSSSDASASPTTSSTAPVTSTPPPAAPPPVTATTTTTRVVPAGPTVGSACYGYQIGARAQAPDGTALVCNNYRWEVYSGQTGDSPWLRGQREWTDCIARNTEEYCRATLNRG